MTQPILLVEDDPGSQELVRALGAARGYAVDVAADGFLGLRLLSERRHPVVLIDYHLPEMDGYALARLMREVVGAQGRVHLVGITADRHGLASRRGADALFDAILVKPLDPDLLYATLESLLRPEAPPQAAPAPPPDPAPQAADALWRGRGFPGRPRAVLCPDLGPEAAAAVGQAFDLCAVEAADLILVGAEAGLSDLRALRAHGPGRLLPAFDLTGRLGRVCDAAFRVDDAASWDGLARICRAFAERRAALSGPVRAASGPAESLMACLHVGDRALSLSACVDPGAEIAETGLSRAALMAAILTLTESGLIACEPAADGLVVRLTEAGRSAATGGEARRATPEDETRPAPAVPRPPAAAPETPSVPVVDEERVARLRAAIGPAEVARLRGDLRARLGSAFPPTAPLPAVAGEAHALVAAAGSLGFLRLSAACRDLETAIRAGADAAGTLLRARRAVREVIDLDTPPAAHTRTT